MQTWACFVTPFVSAMPDAKQFVIFGLSRLSVRVAQSLAETGGLICVIHRADEDEGLLGLLSSAVGLVPLASENYDGALRDAQVGRAECLLVLAEDDMANLRAAVAAQALAPDLAVVLRAFDPVLASSLELGLNVRRAYSVSGLAAPAFIAAATGGDVLETLRLGDGEVPICRLELTAASPLLGLSSSELKSRHGCALLARSRDGEDWRPCPEGAPDGVLAAGGQMLVGGLLPDVLRVCCLNAGWLPARRRAGRGARAPAAPSRRRSTRLPWVAVSLFLVLVSAVVVFAGALRLRLVDSLYFVVTTATTTGYGDISLKDAPDWLKLFGCLVMLSGGALLGILFSHLAAVATAERLDEVMGQRAGRLSGHVVVAGLGNVGYRVARYLTDLGLRVAVLERTTDARFAEAVRARASVLTGDIRLPENLDRVSVRQAVALIACTDDDLANLQACLHARRSNPALATVARVFDDGLAERLTQTFSITRALSASQASVGAFVGAALDERALRSVRLGALSLLACRYTLRAPVDAALLAEWRARGVRLLAYHTLPDALYAPSALSGPLPLGASAILCGPTEAVLAIVGGGDGL